MGSEQQITDLSAYESQCIDFPVGLQLKFGIKTSKRVVERISV